MSRNAFYTPQEIIFSSNFCHEIWMALFAGSVISTDIGEIALMYYRVGLSMTPPFFGSKYEDRLTTETKDFPGTFGKGLETYVLTYNYHLSGGIKSITDPSGYEVKY